MPTAERSTPPEIWIGTARRMVSDVPWEGQVFVTTMPYRNRPSRPTRKSCSTLDRGQQWPISKGRLTTGSRTTSTPVSYTHLRAHETRHDLVCRLLLEKKN